MVNTLIADLSGDLDLTTHQKMHFRQNAACSPWVLMHPTFAEFYSSNAALERSSNPQLRALHEVARLSLSFADRIRTIEELLTLIDTTGGVGTVTETMKWIADDLRQRGKRCIAVITQEALSAGAIVAAQSADHVHCLPHSRLLWHRSMIGEHVSTDEAESIEQANINELREREEARFRHSTREMVLFLMGPRMQLAETFRSRLAQTMFRSERELDVAVLAARLSRRFGASYVANEDVYQQDPSFEVIGSELSGNSSVSVHENVEAMASALQAEGQVADCRSFRDPTSRFLTLAALNEQARAQNLEAKFAMDDNGDLVVHVRDSRDEETIDAASMIAQQWLQ
jgi:hypothetical protein